MTLQQLFSGPKTWTQRRVAVDACGRACDPCSPDAAAWCMLGAITKCCGDRADDPEHMASRRLYEAVGNFVVWNDAPERTFEEVRALVTRLDV